MVTVTEGKGNLSTEELTSEESLREERRRTGRYVATVIAIFVSLFGLYQAMARGTPEYAAFFLPALIMFFYVLWILYASKPRANKSIENIEKDENFIHFEDTEVNSSSTPTTDVNVNVEPKPSTSNVDHTFFRSYSVA